MCLVFIALILIIGIAKLFIDINKTIFPYKAENLIWKIPIYKKNKKSEKLIFEGNFFSHELRLALTIPPGLKMSQKGSFEGTDS